MKDIVQCILEAIKDRYHTDETPVEIRGKVYDASKVITALKILKDVASIYGIFK